MKITFKQKIVSVFAAFALAFAMVPFVPALGTNEAYAAAWMNSYESESKYTYTNGGLIWSYSFSAAARATLDLEWRTIGNTDDYGLYGVIVDGSGNQVFKSTGRTYAGTYTFSEAGQYTFKLMTSTTSGIDLRYSAELKMTDAPQYTYRWQSFTAKAYYDEALNRGCYVELTPSGYDGDDTPNMQFYKQDLDTGKFAKVSAEKSAGSWYYDYKTELGQNLKYYLVNANKLSYASSMPTGIDYVTLSSSAKADLETWASTATVNIEGPDLPSVSNLTNTKGVKTATLEWVGSAAPDVTYFKIQRYNANGVLKATVKMNATEHNYLKKQLYVPYTGTHTFKVTPILELNGTEYQGDSASIKVSSKKIAAPGGGVTKISASKAKITITKPVGADGVRVWKRTNGVWKVIKTFNPGKAGSVTTHRFAWAKNAVGTSRYKFQSFVKDNGVTYYHNTQANIAYKVPGANQCVYNLSSKPSSYADYSHYWKPNKIYYSNGKVKLTGCFINTHIYALSNVKVKVTFKCDGKLVGTKTINSGKISANTSKNHTAVTLTSTAGHDLRNGNKSWSYKVVSWS